MPLTRVELWREVLVGEGPWGEMRLGDARGLMPELLAEFTGQVQLIYMDPPFATGKVFNARVRVGEKEWQKGSGSFIQPAFEDTQNLGEYMDMMRSVLTGARGLLNETGVIFLHTDYRTHARLRLLMDELFGEHNFLNEIVWAYQTGGRASRFFSRKHDVILFYRKGAKYYFNLSAVPIARLGTRRNHMKRHTDADGRTYRSIKSGGKTYTYYDDEPAYPGDVWDDVSHLQQKDPQRTGYDTQKPMRLMDRVILCGSRPGDLVCDLFAGSGTTLESAWRNGRRFIGCDNSPQSLMVTRRRLINANAAFVAPPCEGSPLVDVSVAPAIAHYDIELLRYELEPGACARAFTGMDALDNWAAGYMRGGAFVAQAHEARAKHNPALTGKLQIPVLEGTPCIRVGDVLGRYFYYALNERADKERDQ